MLVKLVWRGLIELPPARPVSFPACAKARSNTSATAQKSIGFESGVYQYAVDDLTFRDIGALPEPSSCALMLAGFNVIGGSMRARRLVTSG